MRPVRTLLFTISFLLCFGHLTWAQDKEQKEQKQDSIAYPNQFGLRLGVDISKPIRSLLDENYQGFEVVADYRITESYYIAAEVGHENHLFDAPNLKVDSEGNYFKIGANYNAYNNWMDMENSIYVGLRYGFATFKETLKEYTIYSGSAYFEPDVRTSNEEFEGLRASWIELQFGIKTEILKNIYLGVHVELKRRLSQTTPPHITNVYIPGFHRTYERSKFGAGWGYSITYMIPFFTEK